MAIFGKKKQDEAVDTPAPGAAGEGGDGGTPVATGGEDSEFSRKKADVFFDRAKSVFETTNYEYAMQLWLSGLRQDPTSMDGLLGFLAASERFVQENGKKGVSKDTAKSVTGKGGVNKYIQALLTFGTRPMDCGAALKSAEAAAGLNLHEPAVFLGRVAFALAMRDKKQRKDIYVRLLDVFDNAGAFDEANSAGTEATRLDPTDGPLQNRVRNMSAQATMSRGGYDDTGESGGFRKNIRNADKQAELEQADRIVKSDDVKDRLVAAAEAEYTERPEDGASIEKFGKALLERGKPKDELRAISLYTKAFKETRQFRFRQRAGEIGLRREQRALRRLKANVEAKPDDKALLEDFNRKFQDYRTREIEELRLQVENYPTDLGMKFRLGKVYFDLGKFQEAIDLLQQAQDDAKNRRVVQNLLGQSFLKLGDWDDAAIQTFRNALDGISDDGSDLGMELRYGLMVALQGKAEKDRDLEAANEADKLAAGIAIQQFSYRDVRDRREVIKKLITELRA